MRPPALRPSSTASRRTVLSAATAVGTTTLLAACSGSKSSKAKTSSPASSPSGSATPSTSATTSGSASPSATATVPPRVTLRTVENLGAVTVTGAADKQPTLKYPVPLVATTTVAKAVIVGTGPKVVTGQEVTIDYTGYVGNTGKLFQSSYTTKTPFTFTAAVSSAGVIPGFVKSVVGFPVGSRVLIAIDPKDGYGSTAQGGIPANATLLFVVDIHAAQTRLPHAEGTAVKPLPGFPAVTLTKDIPTAIAKPTGSPPRTLVVEQLIKGTGPVLKKGDPVVFQYLLSLWTTDSRNGTQVSSSWTAGTPAAVPALGASATGNATALIPGLDTALTGQTVGSRIVVCVPSALGYGTKGNGPIKGGDVTTWCLDIIGTLFPTT